jgi:hypothetical protein
LTPYTTATPHPQQQEPEKKPNLTRVKSTANVAHSDVIPQQKPQAKK